MTEKEFKLQYQRLNNIYGDRSKGHMQVWWDQFKDAKVDEFKMTVAKCIREFVPFGVFRWPTPAEFDTYRPYSIPAHRPFVVPHE